MKRASAISARYTGVGQWTTFWVCAFFFIFVISPFMQQAEVCGGAVRNDSAGPACPCQAVPSLLLLHLLIEYTGARHAPARGLCDKHLLLHKRGNVMKAPDNRNPGCLMSRVLCGMITPAGAEATERELGQRVPSLTGSFRLLLGWCFHMTSPPHAPPFPTLA